MELKPGTISPHDLSRSMAAAMDYAFRNQWSRFMGGRPIPFGNSFLELLFVAVAQGVVRHMVENPDAFKVMIETLRVEDHVERIDATGVIPPPIGS